MMTCPRARTFNTGLLALALMTVAATPACAGSAFPNHDAGAEQTETGGSGNGLEITGGSQSTGGEVATGGVDAAGGARALGGGSATGGGTNTGGTVSTGGAKSTGGTMSTGGAQATGGSSKGTGGSSATGAPTWTQLYTDYFASGTAGNCVSSGCHGGRQSPTFNTASSMCSALKSLGYIGNGTASLNKLLKWFKQGGSMPDNNNPAPANAVTDITAWQNAGAACP